MYERLHLLLTGALVWLTPAIAAAESGPTVRSTVDRGVSGIWVLCNVSYSGMRAQGYPYGGWRTAAFIFGFPGTLITYFAVKEREYRAYGVELPPRVR